MQKLINAYRKDPTDMNALKLAHHVEKLNAIVIGEFI